MQIMRKLFATVVRSCGRLALPLFVCSAATDLNGRPLSIWSELTSPTLPVPEVDAAAFFSDSLLPVADPSSRLSPGAAAPLLLKDVGLFNPGDWTDENVKRIAGHEAFDMVETEKIETRTAPQHSNFSVAKFVDEYRKEGSFLYAIAGLERHPETLLHYSGRLFLRQMK